MTKHDNMERYRFELHDFETLLRANGVNKETLRNSTIENHRNMIAQDVGKDWESLATFIGVPSGDVDDIKEIYREPLDRRLAMMRRWHDLWGKEATYLRLVEGLGQIGRRDLIEHLLSTQQPAIGSEITDRNDFCESQHQQKHWIAKLLGLKNVDSIVWSVIPESMLLFFAIIFVTILTLISSIIMGFFAFGKPRLDIFASLQTDSNTTSTEQDFASNITSHPQTIEIFSQRILRNCSFPENDLPIIHPLFIGRENDVHQLLHKVAEAHIVNINGAPGFGKSTLAIHVGYEIVRNGTSVRYVNIEDKVFSIVNQVSKGRAIKPEASSNTDVHQAPQSYLIKLSSYSLSLSRSQIQGSKNEDLFEELQRWSETIKCTTVLILDNCDDILVTTFRHKFLSLISSLVIKSQFKLHIIIVSREKLLYLDSFDCWTVRELNQSASVEMLDKLAPAIDNKSLMVVAELVEGCPLALKVIGQLLHIHGAQLIHQLKKELMTMLDKASIQKQRFRVIMDIAFSRLGALKDCGYILSLFPSSFDQQAGLSIVQTECLEVYLKHSLISEYLLAFNYRYKMHRLTKEYLQEKISISENMTFIRKFRKHFKAMLLTHIKMEEFESDYEKYTLSLELQNLQYLKELLLIDIHLSSEELAVLAVLSDMKLIQPDQLHRYYAIYIQNIREVCLLLDPKHCGQLYTNVVRHLYQQCKCGTLKAYIQNFFYSPCMEYFQCEVVSYLENLYISGVVHLSQDELLYVDLILGCHCKGYHTQTTWSTVHIAVFISCGCIIFVSNFLSCDAATRFYFYLKPISVVMTLILMLTALTIEPTLLINELISKPAQYQMLRILEIITRFVCVCAVLIITMFIAAIVFILPLIILSVRLSMRNDFFIAIMILFSFLSIFYTSQYCCQFIPLCV